MAILGTGNRGGLIPYLMREAHKSILQERPLGLTLIGKERGELCKRGRKTIERAMLMEVLYRYCELTQSEIGGLVGGLDYSAVSQSRKRLQIRMEQEPRLRKRFDTLHDQFLQMSRIKI